MTMVAKYTSGASVPGGTGQQQVSLSLATSPSSGAGEGLTQVATALDAAATRIQNREDVISRGRDENAFKTNVSTEWQRVQDQEDLTDRKTFGTFNAFVNQQKADLLSKHRGSTNSLTLLDAELTSLAGSYERVAVSATREAQIESLSRQFGDKSNQIISKVASGAMDVPEAFLEINKFAVGDNTVGGALPTNVTLNLVDALQSQIIITKIEGDLRFGDEAGIARAKARLDQNPHFAEILSTSQLVKIEQRIRDQETAAAIADINIAKKLQYAATEMGFDNWAKVPPALKIQHASGWKVEPPKPYAFQSDAGKQAQDRQQLVAMAGGNENAETVRAFDESIAQSNKNAASSKVGKLIQDLQNLKNNNVPDTDPRVKALQIEINNENPEYVAEQDRIQKFVPAVAAFETFNRQALSLVKDAKKALMLLTGENTFKAAKEAAADKSFSTFTSGLLSGAMGLYRGSDRNELDAILTRIGGKAMLDALSALKSASPTGASGMGALNETEGNALRFQEGALDSSAPQTTAATLIDLIENTDSIINSQLNAFKSAFPTRGVNITANLIGSELGNKKRYTREELEKLRRNKSPANEEDQ